MNARRWIRPLWPWALIVIIATGSRAIPEPWRTLALNGCALLNLGASIVIIRRARHQYREATEHLKAARKLSDDVLRMALAPPGQPRQPRRQHTDTRH